MKNIVKPALILMFTAFLAAFVLSHVKEITYPEIIRQAREKENRAFSIVLPGYEITEKRDLNTAGGVFSYWIAVKTADQEIHRAYAFIASKPGYSGEVRSMVGVDSSGKIMGVYILKQTETPGLGARCAEVASKNTFWGRIMGSSPDEQGARPWFQLQFSGIDALKEIRIVQKGDWNPSMSGDLLGSNAVTSISGATITTRTLIESISEALRILAGESLFNSGEAEEAR